MSDIIFIKSEDLIKLFFTLEKEKFSDYDYNVKFNKDVKFLNFSIRKKFEKKIKEIIDKKDEEILILKENIEFLNKEIEELKIKEEDLNEEINNLDYSNEVHKIEKIKLMSIETIKEEIKDEALKCKICYNNDINTCLECGHIFCKECVNNVTTCPTCRIEFKTENNRILFIN